MRIAKLYRYQIPIETGIILHQRSLNIREGLICALQENGRMGWGEIAPLPGFSQENLAEATKQTQQWINQWQSNNTIDLEQLLPSVAFGISCALAELNHTLSEQGEYRTAPLCGAYPDKLSDRLKLLSGEKIAKMKVGRGDPKSDGELADLFLNTIPDLKLRLDANRIWRYQDASDFAQQISPKNRNRIQFIEEPCQSPELSRQFAEQYNLAIAWDETVREPNFQVKKIVNLTAIIIKPTLIGSIQQCVNLIEQAHQQDLLAVISSSIESSLGLTQLARLAYQYTPNTLPGLDTLNLMQSQLLRAWPGSNLPIAQLNSPFIRELSL